jgi:protein-tyrosine phosphatase
MENDLKKENILEKVEVSISEMPHEEIDKITEKVYLGNYLGAEDVEYLSKIKVSNVLICAKQGTEHAKDKFIYKKLEIEDSFQEFIIVHFKDCIQFIEEANGNVYVHCMAGISRSVTIVIAYLMWKNKLPYKDAYWFVKNKRKFISPNEGFVKQLKKFEEMLIKADYNLDDIF